MGLSLFTQAIIIISDDDDENLGLNFTGPNSQDDIFSQLTSCVGQWPKKNSRGSTKVSEVPAPIPNPVTNPDKTVEDAQAVMASFFKAADEATALQEEADNFNPAGNGFAHCIHVWDAHPTMHTQLGVFFQHSFITSQLPPSP